MIDYRSRHVRYDGSRRTSRADIDDTRIPVDDVSIDIRTEDDTFVLLLSGICVAPFDNSGDAARVEGVSRYVVLFMRAPHTPCYD